jgi:hypothetical protein
VHGSLYGVEAEDLVAAGIVVNAPTAAEAEAAAAAADEAAAAASGGIFARPSSSGGGFGGLGMLRSGRLSNSAGGAPGGGGGLGSPRGASSLGPGGVGSRAGSSLGSPRRAGQPASPPTINIGGVAVRMDALGVSSPRRSLSSPSSRSASFVQVGGAGRALGGALVVRPQ